MSVNKDVPSGGSAQNWKNYTESQVHEKERFLVLLHDICQGIDTPEQESGRPRLPLSGMLFCMILKVYSLLSSRRFMSDLREAFSKGLISFLPHFNSISRYFGMELITPLLHRLIEESSRPLKSVETIFAVDSTGLRTCRRRKWFNRHKDKTQERRQWIKLHCICAVQSNTITSAQVSDGHANDNPFFQELVRDTARVFKISEVSADAGYVGAHNQRQVLLLGGMAYIAYKANSTADGEPKSSLCKRMLRLYQEHHPEFMEHYYKRNNVESTFFMLKARFGGRVLSKSERGQINEALCKVICHNLCVLVQSIYELGIEPRFFATDPEPPPVPQSRLEGRVLPDEEYAAVQHRIPAARKGWRGKGISRQNYYWPRRPAVLVRRRRSRTKEKSLKSQPPLSK
jgi:transposase